MIRLTAFQEAECMKVAGFSEAVLLEHTQLFTAPEGAALSEVPLQSYLLLV